MIRNIVFDMGMVLMDFHPIAACRAAAPDEESAQLVFDALFAHPEWLKLDDNTIEQDELGRRAMARLREDNLRALVPLLLDGLPENVLSPIPGMAELTDGLIRSGLHVYLLSNAGLVFSRKRDIVPNIDRFHGVLFSADEGLVKPDPAIYRLLTARYGLRPEECLFVDDKEENVQAAKELGWSGYLFHGDVEGLRKTLAAMTA